METILVPLDGSDLSALALPYADLFSRLQQAEVRLLHVVTESDHHDFVVEREPFTKLTPPPGTVAPNSPWALQLHADAHLEQAAAKLRAEGLQVQTEVVYGTPVDAIVAVAERCAASMIVMGTHGRGGLGRWLIGSVAHSVMRLTAVPVLAVRNPAPEQPALRRIMVPLDGSPLAREALPLALDLAKRSGATLVLLTVLTPQIGFDPSIMPQPGPTAKSALREQLLHELDTHVPDRHHIPMQTVIGEGMVGETICHEAEQQAADLIIMTSHGQSGLHHFALGSATDRVLHGTHVPVLVLHSRAHSAAVAAIQGRKLHSTN
ncbi:MAG: universal stress protein [Chloroflexales bacterium]